METEQLIKSTYLDPSFGELGILHIEVPGNFRNHLPYLTNTPQSQLIIYGEYERENHIGLQAGVGRLLSDGKFDLAFGEDQEGLTTGAEIIPNLQTDGLAFLPDGSFFIISAAEKPTLFHYDKDGKVIAHWDPVDKLPHAYARRLLTTPDSKLLIATNDLTDGVIFRRNRDGSNDSDFGDDGKKTFMSTRFYIGVWQVIQKQRSSSFYIAGEADNEGFILRMKADGERDETFANGGIFYPPKEGARARACRRISEHSDGTLLSLVSAEGGTSPRPLLMRLTAAGQMDPAFNNGEPLILESDLIEDLAVQTDGRILVIHRRTTSQIGSYLTRYLPDGKPDNSFGDEGTIYFPAQLLSTLKSVTLQSDGKIVVAGTYGTITRLFRLLP